MAECAPFFKRHEEHYRLDDGRNPATGGNSRFPTRTANGGGEWRSKAAFGWDILEALLKPQFKQNSSLDDLMRATTRASANSSKPESRMALEPSKLPPPA